jgi:hypothetical protein
MENPIAGLKLVDSKIKRIMKGKIKARIKMATI